jgi:NADPH-dependent glutamate synthase beta subunit-like oxidoreductase/ferredoxin
MGIERRLPVIPGADWLWENEPCRAVCPVHTDAGAYVTAIAAGRDREAYRIARAPNPFPSICGRICAAPCEAVCRRAAIDAPVAIRALKRFVAERFGVESLGGAAEWHAGHGVVPPASGPSVGVIGGGPGGLAAAHDLRLAGHPVTIYEAADELGGMMVLGIPEFRLPRAVIRAEIAALRELGITVVTGCRVGRDIGFAELRARHAALFVAVGTGEGRVLDLPGRELDGVVRALEFLLNANRGFRAELGERVVVVGGGNVALDAARTALRTDVSQTLTTTLDAARAAKRSGVRDVTILALESPAEMPAAGEELVQAVEEGITIRHRTGVRRLLGDGHVRGVETIGVASVFDPQGRFAPAYIAGSESELAADTVIFAVGQAADLSFLPADVPLARSAIGGLAVDSLTLRTSDPRVWAGGDVAFGPRNLIDAIADGRRAAAAISAMLRGEPAVAPAPRRVRLSTRPALRDVSSSYDAAPRHAVPGLPSARRVGPAEVELGYAEAEARAEAGRCLHCFDNIVLQPERCILCGLCVDVCPYHCLSIGRADRYEGGTPAQSVLLLDEARCIRCGLCVTRCPPGALAMAHAEVVAHA